MATERAVGVVVLALALAASAEPLVGPGVGNSDTLVAEGSKLFNRKDYAGATSNLLKATRASPATLATYLQLARASLFDKQLTRACYAYRVYLKASPDTPERKKAAAESDQCERQLKGAKGQPADPTPRYVELRATFFATLEKGELVGVTGAAQALRQLVQEGFLGPELGEMAQKLGAAVVAQADGIFKKVMALERVPTQDLRAGRPLLEVAAEVGASLPDVKARMAFFDGLAELADRSFAKAEPAFAEAARADPSNKEYVFYRALALFQGGERFAALKALEADLKDDPRTHVLRVTVALGHSPENGAAELEKLLFTTRFPQDK
jgi:tetratricopeptide (TPR) repeat protein